MKKHFIDWHKSAFIWQRPYKAVALIAFVLSFTPAIVVAQSNGVSATANRLSDSANGSRASASGLSQGASGSSVGKANALGASTGSDNLHVYDTGSTRGVDTNPLGGPCGAAYRKDRKLGKNPGSRLGCGSEAK